MPNPIRTITDAGLADMLAKSVIDANQKKELQVLIPDMDDNERMELIALIEQSNREAEKADEKYQNKVGEINKEYDGKINRLVKETTVNAYRNAEKSESAKESEILSSVDAEIVTAQMAYIQPTEVKKKKSHMFRNLFIMIILLLAAGGGALYALQMLSNTK